MKKRNHPIRVLIVDDHDMLREGLHSFIRSFDDLELVGEASTGAEAVEICNNVHPDVILMDLVMPEMDGPTAIAIIHHNLPEIRILALSSFGDETLVKNALRNGAIGYLLKNVSAAHLADAIRHAADGLPTLAPEITQQLIEGATSESKSNFQLTHREAEVLALVVEGFSNSKISEKLCISLYTVKNHVSSILAKMGVKSRTEAVSLAIKNNLVK
jgi:two-component system, NarL family, response regulator LiaR